MARPRKPKEAHVLNGTFRPDRHGDNPPARGVPVMPADLPAEAKTWWQTYVPDLVELGVAGSIDAPALQMLARWWAEYCEAIEQVGKTKDPELKRRWLAVAGDACKWVEKLGGKFGLTPVDRVRIKIEPPKAVDPMTEFLSAKPAKKKA
jgi:phage terminase small subunit